MDEKDFQRIGQLVAQIVDSRLAQMSTDIDSKLEQMSSGFDSKLDRHKEEIVKEFGHQTTIQTEQFHKAMAIVVEGHQMLADKIERVELRLEKRIDSLAEQLDAHRCDTKAHGSAYRIMEE